MCSSDLNDGDLYYFMDNTTYEQIALGVEQIGDSLKFEIGRASCRERV